jgi:hypothetical protein
MFIPKVYHLLSATKTVTQAFALIAIVIQTLFLSGAKFLPEQQRIYAFGICGFTISIALICLLLIQLNKTKVNVSQIIKKPLAAQTPLHVNKSWSFINREIKGLTENSQIYCVTFKKNIFDPELGSMWVIHNTILVPMTVSGFKIERSLIKQHLEDEDFPFKFYLLIDNDKRVRTRYSLSLLEANCIVTGLGDADPINNNKWRIWFLVDGEPIHPIMYSASDINHILPNGHHNLLSSSSKIPISEVIPF